MQRTLRAVVAFIGLWLAGCAPGAVEKDLVNYINQDLMGVVAVERAAMERYANVSGENYVSDRELYAALKHEVIPTFAGLVDVLHGIEPETETVQRLHAKFINGAEYRLRGFQAILGGLRTQDAQIVRAANRLFDEGEHEIERWRLELQQLYEAYGIRQRTP
jgi:DNA-binding phage protein